MSQMIGTQSIQFDHAPYIQSSASIVGSKEGEGPLGKLFDVVGEDDKFGEETWEEAESTLQKEAVTLALGKADLKKKIFVIFLAEICWDKILPPPSESWS